MRVFQIGNFRPPHSTENELRRALERLGHTVTLAQENTRETWAWNPEQMADVDLILWTRTGWDWQHDCGWSTQEAWQHQLDLLDFARVAGIPTVGYHLDRWFGLDREGQVTEEPFFRCDLVCTADGGHDPQFAAAGVNHLWMPPAVSMAETERRGRPMPRRYPGRVAFVGAWDLRQREDGTWTGYHDEWAPHRRAMLDACRGAFGRQFRCYPQGRALRGQALADLYVTVPVFVGDSCLAPIDDPPMRYWSDRIPETLGRGGLLVHPDPGWNRADTPEVCAMANAFPWERGLRRYPPGDFDLMLTQIDTLLSLGPGDLADTRDLARAWVRARHTYEVRLAELLRWMSKDGMLKVDPEEDQ